MRQIYADEGLRNALQLKNTPSTDAVGDWLRRMGSGCGLSTVMNQLAAPRMMKDT